MQIALLLLINNKGCSLRTAFLFYSTYSTYNSYNTYNTYLTYLFSLFRAHPPLLNIHHLVAEVGRGFAVGDDYDGAVACVVRQSLQKQLLGVAVECCRGLI